MQTPEVQSFREFRAGLAANFRRVQEGEPVFVGPHRRATAVMMSAAHYKDLVELSRRRAAVAEALGSLRAEGLSVSEEGMDLLECIVAGTLTEDEAIEALTKRYRR